MPPKEILKRRQFQSCVGSSLILVNAEASRKRGRPSIEEQTAAKPARRKAQKGPSPDVHWDAVGHWPEKTDKRGRCAQCTTGYSDTACEKNAQCGFASIISVTVSSCIIRSTTRTLFCTVILLWHMNWYLTLPIYLNFTISVLLCHCFWHFIIFL